MESREPGYYLGTCFVDPADNRLYLEGCTVVIEPKAMDVLSFLAAHPDQVISADQLLSACWPGQILGDSPVYKVITQLRKALRDDPKQPTYIRTVPKRGYRLIATVTPATDTNHSQSPTSAFWHDESPFPGLTPFSAHHAPVFFGRTKQTLALIRRLQQAMQNACAFVLLLGKSGSGKSSLVNAGVVPLTTGPDGYEEVRASASATLTPHHHHAISLTHAVFELLHEYKVMPGTLYNTLPQQPLTALPENVTTFFSPTASHGTTATPFLLIVDPLETLFTSPADDMAGLQVFIDCLSLLARSGKVSIIGVLRNDDYPAFMESPVLAALKEDGAQYDLTAPTAAEIAQMIRRPAQAAGLTFEHDPVSQEHLDDLLLADVSQTTQPLPLLQYCLQELYLRCDRDKTLLLSIYTKMGGVRGALATQAERVYQSLTNAAQQELPRLLHYLIRLHGSAQGHATRMAMNTHHIWNKHCTELVNAFISARLFTQERIDGVNHLQITHDALLQSWPRIRQWLAENRAILTIRTDVISAANRWHNEHRAPALLYPSAERLDAMKLLTDVAAIRLSPTEQTYIQASRQRLRQIKYTKRVALGVLVLLATITSYASYHTYLAQQAAVHSKSQAEQLVRFMLGDLHQRLQQVGRLDILEQVGEEVSRYVNTTDARYRDRDTLQQQAQAMKLVGEVYLAQAHNGQALTAFTRAYELTQELADQTHNDATLLQQIGETSYWVGYVHYLRGELSLAEQYWQRYHQAAHQWVMQQPEQSTAWLELSYAYNNLGTLALERNDYPTAIDNFTQSITWKQKLLSAAPDNAAVSVELADSYSWLGTVYNSIGNLAQSAQYYQQELTIVEQYAARDLNNYDWQYRLARALQRSGELSFELGDSDTAYTYLNRARDLLNQLLRHDPERLDWRWDSAAALVHIGRVWQSVNQLDLARETYDTAITQISQLVHRDDSVVEWHRTHAVAMIERAAIARTQQQLDSAQTMLKKAISELQQLNNNTPTTHRVAISLADAYVELGLVFQQQNAESAANQQWQRAQNILAQHLPEKPDKRFLISWFAVLTYLGDWTHAREPYAQLVNMGYRTKEFARLEGLISEQGNSDT